MSYDYLPTINLPIKQRDGIFKMNTDTHLLGMFITIKHKDVVLDIGCNTGALLLYASIYKPKKLIGVDINSVALKLAKENMALNNLDADLLHTRIQDLNLDQVDVIICNPPYFTEKNFNKNSHIKNARHTSSLSLDDLFKSFRRLIKQKGKIFMVFRANKISEIIDIGLKNDIKINRMQFVYDVDKDYAVSVLLELSRGTSSNIKVEKPKEIKR